MRHHHGIATLLPLGACLAEAPASPSFQEDVMPILAASCVRCHASPPIGGAPGSCDDAVDGVRWCGFRLDSYDDVIIDEGDPADPDDDRGVRGAAFMTTILPSKLRDPRSPMPPRFPLQEVALDTLITWSQGEPPDRTPRPGNLRPALTVDLEAAAGGVVILRYDLDDGDADLVVGGLRAVGPGQDLLVAPIQSGRDELRWDTAGLSPGTYELVARVDDGAGWIDLPAGAVSVGAP